MNFKLPYTGSEIAAILEKAANGQVLSLDEKAAVQALTTELAAGGELMTPEQAEKLNGLIGFDGEVEVTSYMYYERCDVSNLEIGKMYKLIYKHNNNKQTRGILLVSTENISSTRTYNWIVGKEFHSKIQNVSEQYLQLNNEATTIPYLFKYDVQTGDWDSAPTADSKKPVTSRGIKTYVDNNKGTKLYKHRITFGSDSGFGSHSIYVITTDSNQYDTLTKLYIIAHPEFLLSFNIVEEGPGYVFNHKVFAEGNILIPPYSYRMAASYPGGDITIRLYKNGSTLSVSDSSITYNNTPTLTFTINNSSTITDTVTPL